MKRAVQIIAICLVLAPWAGAQMIVQHQGTNNPTTEGFTQGNGGGLSLFPTNDAGTQAWTILDNNVSDGVLYYAFFSVADRARLAPMWNVVWNFNLIDAPDPDSVRVNFTLTNSTGNARRYVPQFQRIGNDVSVVLPGGPAVPLQVGAGVGFHTWQLIRTNPASDVAEFYLDGVFLANYSGFNDSQENISFGTGGGNATTSHTEWRFLYVEVPEPSTLGLIGVAAAIGMAFRKRR